MNGRNIPTSINLEMFCRMKEKVKKFPKFRMELQLKTGYSLSYIDKQLNGVATPTYKLIQAMGDIAKLVDEQNNNIKKILEQN